MTDKISDDDIRRVLRHGLETGKAITGPVAQHISAALDAAFTESLAARCQANGLTIEQAAGKYIDALEKSRVRMKRFRKNK